MKRNLFKSLFIVVASAAAMAACNDTGGTNGGEYTIPAEFGFYNPVYAGIKMEVEKCELTVLKSGEAEGTVHLSISDNALAEYNSYYKTSYLQLPSDLYDISATTLNFTAADNRKNIEVTWNEADIEALDVTKSYVIAIQLSSDESSHVSEVKNYVIVHPIPPIPVVSMEMGIAPAIGFRMDRQADNHEIKVEMDIVSKKTVTANYTIDNSLIDFFNTINGTHYTAVPDGFISLPSSSVEIPAGETSAKFPYQTQPEVFFTGNVLDKYDSNGHLIPIRITSVSNGLLDASNNVMFIPVKLTVKEIKGPWTVLEGTELCYANQPGGRPGWAGAYTTNRLFDGDLATEWISWWFDAGESTQEQNIPFPMSFVVDMGKVHLFTGFCIADYMPHSGNYRQYEMYIAEEYDSENPTNTEWSLAANGKCDYDGTRRVYNYPPADGTLNLIAGRYLKFVIVNPQYPFDNAVCKWGRGKLSEIYGTGY